MWKVPIQEIKGAFAEALKLLPDFKELEYLDLGDIVDQAFKSLMKDLMSDFDMKPGIDYIDNLSNTAPGADFVICSLEANNLIKDLLTGKLSVVKAHTRTKNGKQYSVSAHLRRF